MIRRNLIILVLCQLISATGSIVFVTLGSIVGHTLSQEAAWATLPITVSVLATAMATVPATMLMRALGRSRGFALASLSAGSALLLATWAIGQASFAGFAASAGLFGVNMAFTQQYRYAAAESVPPRYIPRAISFVLIGSIGGALLGPQLAKGGETWFSEVPYAGTLIALAVLYGTQAVLFLFLKAPAESGDTGVIQSDRSLRSIMLQPVFLVAVLCGTAAYGLMVLIMTATPLSMNVKDGHSVADTYNVIQGHVLGMYVPSLISGFLIERLGVVRMMVLGVFGLLATSVVGLQGQSVMHYWWALALLGVGWNFTFVGATTMLTYTYSLAERYRAQAVSEFTIFGVSAVSSLLAGTTMYYFGWRQLMWIPVPVLAVVLIALMFIRNDALLHRPDEPVYRAT